MTNAPRAIIAAAVIGAGAWAWTWVLMRLAGVV